MCGVCVHVCAYVCTCVYGACEGACIPVCRHTHAHTRAQCMHVCAGVCIHAYVCVECEHACTSTYTASLSSVFPSCPPRAWFSHGIYHDFRGRSQALGDWPGVRERSGFAGPVDRWALRPAPRAPTGPEAPWASPCSPALLSQLGDKRTPWGQLSICQARLALAV